MHGRRPALKTIVDTVLDGIGGTATRASTKDRRASAGKAGQQRAGLATAPINLFDYEALAVVMAAPVKTRRLHLAHSLTRGSPRPIIERTQTCKPLGKGMGQRRRGGAGNHPVANRPDRRRE